MQTAEIARATATAAIEERKQKEEAHLREVSENAAAKIKNDYIEFIKKGVLTGIGVSAYARGRWELNPCHIAKCACT